MVLPCITLLGAADDSGASPQPSEVR